MNDLAHPARARLTFVPWMTLMMIMAPLIQGTLSANDLRCQAQVHPTLILRAMLMMTMTILLTRMQRTPLGYRSSTQA